MAEKLNLPDGMDFHIIGLAIEKEFNNQFLDLFDGMKTDRFNLRYAELNDCKIGITNTTDYEFFNDFVSFNNEKVILVIGQFFPEGPLTDCTELWTSRNEDSTLVLLTDYAENTVKLIYPKHKVRTVLEGPIKTGEDLEKLRERLEVVLKEVIQQIANEK